MPVAIPVPAAEAVPAQVVVPSQVEIPVPVSLPPASTTGPVRTKHFITLPQFTRTHFFIIVGIILLLGIAAAPGYYFYTEYQKAQLKLTNPTKAAQMEVEETIQKIKKHILLPEGETPSFATVSDVSKLQSQDFFKQAQNGDKVLIYSKAKKAILYRPATDLIIEVSPLEIAEAVNPTPAEARVSTTPAPIVPVKVTILNGTGTVGLGGKVETEMKKAIDALEVVDVLNAEKNDYARTLIIPLNKRGQDVAKDIAKVMNGEVTNLPNTEKAPEGVDILVIAGRDKVNSNTKATVTPTLTPAFGDAFDVEGASTSTTPAPTSAPAPDEEE